MNIHSYDLHKTLKLLIGEAKAPESLFSLIEPVTYPAARLPKVCQFNVDIGPGPMSTLGLAQSPHWAGPNVYIGPGPISTLGQVQYLYWAWPNLDIGPGPMSTLDLAQS